METGEENGYNFHAPVRKLLSPPDLERFKASPICQEIKAFVVACAESVKGVSLSEARAVELPEDSVVLKMESYMSTLEALVDEVPPLQQPMRYGNKAFRTWHARMLETIPAFLKDILPLKVAGASVELGPYLADCYGNETRIDYGTGHEAMFALFLLALFKLRVFVEADFKLVVLRCFPAYLRTVRRVQTEYLLEPAGSHGVWGLDDYHCLLFLWGAAQLRDHAEIVPSSIQSDTLLKQHKNDWLYLQGIAFIKEIKFSAPFAETSPMLHDISFKSDWVVVHRGMIKLFEGEVLHKFPVIQHFLFGSIIAASWDPAPTMATTVPSCMPAGVVPGMMTRRPGAPPFGAHLMTARPNVFTPASSSIQQLKNAAGTAPPSAIPQQVSQPTPPTPSTPP